MLCFIWAAASLHYRQRATTCRITRQPQIVDSQEFTLLYRSRVDSTWQLHRVSAGFAEVEQIASQLQSHGFEVRIIASRRIKAGRTRK